MWVCGQHWSLHQVLVNYSTLYWSIFPFPSFSGKQCCSVTIKEKESKTRKWFCKIWKINCTKGSVLQESQKRHLFHQDIHAGELISQRAAGGGQMFSQASSPAKDVTSLVLSFPLCVSLLKWADKTGNAEAFPCRQSHTQLQTFRKWVVDVSEISSSFPSAFNLVEHTILNLLISQESKSINSLSVLQRDFEPAFLLICGEWQQYRASKDCLLL